MNAYTCVRVSAGGVSHFNIEDSPQCVCKMATLQEPSHGKQMEGGGGSVKKTIALKLKTTKKEEGIHEGEGGGGWES